MYLITVIPIARGINVDELTYLSPSQISPGSLIGVPLRKKTIKAIVLSADDAKKQKMAIKSSTFLLKKVDTLVKRKFLSDWQIGVIKKLSKYHASSEGAVIFSLINKKILESSISFDNFKNIEIPKKPSHLAFEGTSKFRLEEYIKIIKNNLRNNQSTIILCPTLDSIQKLESLLAKIELKSNTISFQNKKTKRQILLNAERIINNENLIILTTGSFLFLIPENTGTLIIEEENSRWYKMQSRPFLNFVKASEEVSDILNLNVVYGDILLRCETYEKTKKIQKEKIIKKDITILTSKKVKEDPHKNQPYKALNKEIEESIKKAISKKTGNVKVFIWSVRKGFAPIVLCLHCGATVMCENCDSPVVLYKKTTDPYLLCHHCGAKRSALEKCKKCQSWKLDSFGIGIERIQEEVNDKFKNNLDLIKTGTEKDVYAGDETYYNLAVVPSIDSLLSIPDFDIDERLFRTILIIKEKTKEIIIQTKYNDLPLLQYIKNFDTNEFHKDRLNKRKQFGYGPYKVLIKITVRGKKETVISEMNELKANLIKWKPTVFPAFIKTVKNQFILHLLLKLPADEWPDDELVAYLQSLPPSFEINVEPYTLL
jgi:primosomal protein N' (replication factor Y) (superfamily II helicase)